MKQVVRFEVFLSNSDESLVFVKPTHIFEEFFECVDRNKSKEMDDAIFEFEWKVRSFVFSCKDVFKYVSVNKVVKIVDYAFS